MFLKMFYLITGLWNLVYVFTSNSIWMRTVHLVLSGSVFYFLLESVDYDHSIDRLQARLCKLTGRRFWYQVKFQGKDGDGQLRWVLTNSIGVAFVKAISNDRELKRVQFGQGIKRKYPKLPIAKDYQVIPEVVTYLGWY